MNLKTGVTRKQSTKFSEKQTEIFVFYKIWHALFPSNNSFDICPFALLPTNFVLTNLKSVRQKAVKAGGQICWFQCLFWVLWEIPQNELFQRRVIWDQIFKNEPRKICGRQYLKNLAVFHKFYLVHSWILCPILPYNRNRGTKLFRTVKRKIRIMSCIIPSIALNS